MKNHKDSWHVNVHKEKIRKGDKALLYITGSKAGFYGTADINSDVYELSSGSFCDIEIEYLFLDDPITKNVIINNPILRESKAGSQGSNFVSKKEEYEEVLRIMTEKEMLESKYRYFNAYDLELLKIGFEEYLKFSKETPENEEYKYKIIDELRNLQNLYG